MNFSGQDNIDQNDAVSSVTERRRLMELELTINHVHVERTMDDLCCTPL